MRAHPLHHLHRRKHAHLGLDPYPHPVPWKAALDRLVLVVAVAAPIFTIPQAYKIWVEHAVLGVSLTTWVAYFFSSVVWLVYGVVHREKPILLSASMNLIINAIIVAGIIVFSAAA